MITELKKEEINHTSFIVTIPQKIVDIYVNKNSTDRQNELAEMFFAGLNIAIQSRARVAAEERRINLIELA